MCCAPVTRTPTQICIVGGGLSGLHLAWLLARRGYTPTVFERRDRVGGKAHTAPPLGNGEDDVTRELGAAFLSPDYVEVRAFLKRFNLTEVSAGVGAVASASTASSSAVAAATARKLS